MRTAAGEAIAAPVAHPFIATFLLTGGRLSEVLGLELDDVSFDRRTVTFRPNQWRRLKTRESWRVVPLWPQVEEILRAYVFGHRLARPGRLLFPAFRTQVACSPEVGAPAAEEAMLTETRKLLERVARRVAGNPARSATGSFGTPTARRAFRRSITERR